jgi:predicted RNase H-like nuclease (RuvC/YqgF family)
MQDPFEENKVLQKALIIASSSLKEVESKMRKLKEENAELKKSVPSFTHMKLNMPLLLDETYKKLAELRQSAVINKNIRLTLQTQVQELKETFTEKDSELKQLQKKEQLEKKGSYSKLNINRKGTGPVCTPKHTKNKSGSFYFG